MSRITIVLEGATQPIHLGMSLAGGRLTSASLGDHSEMLDTAKGLLRALYFYNQMPEDERLAIERDARDLIEKAEAA
jgi:hypothetical protein